MSAAVLPESPPTPAEAVQIRAKPPSPKRLSRKVLMGAALGVGGIVAFALLSGLSEKSNRRGGARVEDAPAAAPALPETVRVLPSQYTPDTLKPAAVATDKPRDMLWGEDGPPEGWENPYKGGEADLQPPTDAFWAEKGSGSTVRAAKPAAAERDPQADALAAPIFFDGRRGVVAKPAAARSGDSAIEGGGRREGFIVGQKRSADVLDADYVPPRSAFEIQAGAIIPAALVTALDSDLPGRVIAQVTAPVYDSITGDHLLIPQGAKLIGTYDSATAYGDGRLFLVWNRLVMPNGWSIQLAGMEAVDPAGAAGLKDKTDNHLDRLAGAIGLSAILSIVANEAEDGGAESGFTQSVGDAAAQEAARVGGRIVDREMNVRPTLRVRAGAPVRLLVTRDVSLKPYPS